MTKRKKSNICLFGVEWRMDKNSLKVNLEMDFFYKFNNNNYFQTMKTWKDMNDFMKISSDELFNMYPDLKEICNIIEALKHRINANYDHLTCHLFHSENDIEREDIENIIKCANFDNHFKNLVIDSKISL